MWAHQLEAPGRLVRRSVPTLTEDDLAEGQVLVAYEAGSICGSDLPGFAGRRSPLVTDPRSTGSPLHEVVGTVVGTRSEVFAVGQRVVGWAADMRGLRERFLALDTAVALVDETLSSVAATVVQPLCCAVYGVDQIAALVDDLTGLHCAVVGLGTLGVLFAHVLADRGALVTGIDPVDRRNCATAFGLHETITEQSSTWARGMTDAERPDVVVEVVGHQIGTLVDAIESVAPGGLVYGFGVPDDPVYPIPFECLFRKSAVLTGGVTMDRRRSLEDAQRYLLAHPELPGTYLTHRFGEAEAQSAFETASLPAPGRLKVVIVP